MKSIADYAVFLGKELMDVAVKVTFVNSTGNFSAAYAAGGDLHFNLFRLGYAWFEKSVNEEVDSLLSMKWDMKRAATISANSIMSRFAAWAQSSKNWRWRSQRSFVDFGLKPVEITREVKQRSRLAEFP
jgi:hypothetical protein